MTSENYDSNGSNPAATSNNGGIYEIKIKGLVDDHWQQWFEGMTLTRVTGRERSQDFTLMRGPIQDQPALHGLLAKIRDLNLTLLSIHRINSTLNKEATGKDKQTVHIPLSEVELTKEITAGIPILKCFQKETRQKPLVILSHGFRGNKESWIPQLHALAEHGYYAVALDNKKHGERQELNTMSQVFEGGKLDASGVQRLINETAEDISRLIDYFAAVTDIDQNRIGMSGVSIGGFVTFRAFVMDRRIKVAAPIGGSPFWDDFSQDLPGADDIKSQQILASLASDSSPAFFPERFAPRPLLIQIGSLARRYDVNRVKAFVERLAEDYYKSDAYRLKLIVHEGIGHEFTFDMWTNVMTWFDQYL